MYKHTQLGYIIIKEQDEVTQWKRFLLNNPRLNDIAPSIFPMRLIESFRMCYSHTRLPEMLLGTLAD